ncbi:MAG: hypothetical protein HXK06_00080 [Actinomyces graevenitzii]|nr:hypothetical protein [Actinomyces graevenitzii]
MDEIERLVGDLIRRAEEFDASDVTQVLVDSLEGIKLANKSIEILENMREIRSNIAEWPE